MRIGTATILISRCTPGVYLRWWFNGWHYFNFQNGYEVTMKTESLDMQVTRMFSVVSKVERPTRIKSEYSYNIILEGISAANIPGFMGLLMAEKVEQYEGGIWREVEVTRGDHLIKDPDSEGYILDFEITRKEIPVTSSVYHRSVKLYVGDTLCDMDDDEIVPLNKQVNDIAEMQDRQSDFTAQFKIRKTRRMRALFELSGEVGTNTTFPYEIQSCKLVQNSVEMITAGEMVLDKVDEQYYYVSILSGNLNFFKAIGNSKITDLTYASHAWTIANIKAGHDAVALPDYLYPLCEPSDDSGIAPIRLVANTIEMYGGYIWAFIKVELIWNAIFSEAAYTCEGDILDNFAFKSLYMPISSRSLSNEHAAEFLYSAWWFGYYYPPPACAVFLFGYASPCGTGYLNVINGDDNLKLGYYLAPFTATYRIEVGVQYVGALPTISLWVGVPGAHAADFAETYTSDGITHFEITYNATKGDFLSVHGTAGVLYYIYQFAVKEIKNIVITYGDTVDPALHLPPMSQVDFIKMICNIFGLIPEVTARDRKIKFWNYQLLYDNVPIARDWSAYLSETEDEAEFKFGDYAQLNYLKYKASDDVIVDNGKGTMQVDDETLPFEKDILELSVSTCDEDEIATTIPTIASRIAFNKYDNKVGAYVACPKIDPRIVFVKRATGREFIVWDDVPMVGNDLTIDDPRIACSLEVSFSQMIVNYASLSRLLTKTKLRRAKFNLPDYEVSGLKHYIPIYLSQYKAYFYVNKINNYVPGKLCTIDLIKL